jgi:hypothetical protein
MGFVREYKRCSRDVPELEMSRREMKDMLTYLSLQYHVAMLGDKETVKFCCIALEGLFPHAACIFL